MGFLYVSLDLNHFKARVKDLYLIILINFINKTWKHPFYNQIELKHVRTLFLQLAHNFKDTTFTFFIPEALLVRIEMNTY